MVALRISALPLVLTGLVWGQAAPVKPDPASANAKPPAAAAQPHSRPLSEQRGDILMARKMYREAVDKYLEGDQKSPITWNKVGIAWHQMGNFPMAQKSYERSIKLDKKYADAVNNLSAIYYAQKKYTAAITRYKKAIGLSPGAASFWSNLGTAWYARGKYDQMMECYTKAMELDPQVFEHRGGVGTEMQDRSVADRARYHFEMAKMYAKMGKNDQALLNLRRSLEEGYKEKDKIPKLPEFAGLLDVQEFKDLMAMEHRVVN
jgi:tetratricopeptide (TPR) repeat protein